MPMIKVNEVLCKGCEMCVVACPSHLIALDTTRVNAKGYHPAMLVVTDKCTGCKSCALMCPDVAITMEV